MSGFAQPGQIFRLAVDRAAPVERLVLGDLDPADPFVSTLDALVAARRRFPGKFPDLEHWLTKKLQDYVKQFLTRIAAMAPTT